MVIIVMLLFSLHYDITTICKHIIYLYVPHFLAQQILIQGSFSSITEGNCVTRTVRLLSQCSVCVLVRNFPPTYIIFCCLFECFTFNTYIILLNFTHSIWIFCNVLGAYMKSFAPTWNPWHLHEIGLILGIFVWIFCKLFDTSMKFFDFTHFVWIFCKLFGTYMK